jgi:hypothetical protein
MNDSHMGTPLKRFVKTALTGIALASAMTLLFASIPPVDPENPDGPDGSGNCNQSASGGCFGQLGAGATVFSDGKTYQDELDSQERLVRRGHADGTVESWTFSGPSKEPSTHVDRDGVTEKWGSKKGSGRVLSLF